MSERVESMNAKPAMFQAGISNKFTKRHVDNFHDTTLTAASAAKQRAEKKIEKQAEAIDKQQKKIETEVCQRIGSIYDTSLHPHHLSNRFATLMLLSVQMKKIEEITLKLHRQQVREARRLRNRLHFAATRVQNAFRRSQERWRVTKSIAASRIQCRWRGFIARACTASLRARFHDEMENSAALVITRSFRVYACRLAREQMVIEREYAALVIQSVVRMHFAEKVAVQMGIQRFEERERHHAATVIQSNAKSFMTRLIYLDVLYVICRIQAVMRGFLIRRRLQWVAAIDTDGICKFQALARGFLTRQRLSHHLWELRDGEYVKNDSRFKVDHYDVDNRRKESERSASTNSSLESVDGQPDNGAAHQKEKRVRTMKTAAKPPLQPEPIIKRSHWLPAGVSFNKRLPVLPAKQRTPVVDFDTDHDDHDDLHSLMSDLINTRSSRTPKKRNQRNRPPRLAPVSPPVNGGVDAAPVRLPTEAETELQQVNLALEKLRREEELKHKLLCRKAQEKRKLEHEQKLKREQESEENERKLMEREEKLARLLLKVLHRRSKEVKIKKTSAEQQREERERIAMARDERQTRLLIKLAARQALLKKTQVGTASCNSGVSGASGASSSTITISTSVMPPPPRMKGNRSRSELHSTGGSSSKHSPGAKTMSEGPQDDDNDNDMSFLDIDFKIPESMQKSKKGGFKSSVSGDGGKKHKRQLSKGKKATSSASASASASASTSASAGGEGNQEEIATSTGTSSSRVSGDNNSNKKQTDGRLRAEIAENDFEFDYGSEFEEVIDEAKLGWLIC